MNSLLPALLCVVFWVMFPFSVRAQSTVVDSLDVIIENPKVGTGKRIEAICQKVKILTTQDKFEEAIQLVNRAKQLHKKKQNHKYDALIYSNLMSIYAKQDSLSLAFKALDSAQWYAKRTDDKLIKGRIWNNKGWLEMVLENTDKAYEYRLKALRMLEGLTNEKAAYIRSNIYHHLAATEAHWKNEDKQLKFTTLCLKEALKSKNADAIANAYLSTGSSFLYRYRKDTSRKTLLDSSKYYTKKVLTFSETRKHRITLPNTIGLASLNLANLYYEFYPISYKDSAEIYLNKALKVGRATDNLQIIGNSYGILSGYALKEKDYGRAEDLLSMALAEISSSPTKDTRTRSRIVKVMAQVAEKQNDADKALKFYKQYNLLDKELFDEEKFSITQKLEVQYQSEKQKMALANAQQEASFSKQLNRYYLVLIIAGAIALFFLFRSYHFKLKTSQQQQLLLSGEKNEVELQANLKAEEMARLQAERELMQERLDRLEKELLAGTLQVEEKNTLLKDLKEQLNSMDSNDPLYQKIKRLLSKSNEADNNYKDIKTEFIEIHPDFTVGLQQKAENKLTRLDLKYCSYILMGLTNKEMAVKMNVAPKSIRMARYRIKQKLQLKTEEDLDGFINEMGSKDNIT